MSADHTNYQLLREQLKDPAFKEAYLREAAESRARRTPGEIARTRKALDDLAAESERLGLY